MSILPLSPPLFNVTTLLEQLSHAHTILCFQSTYYMEGDTGHRVFQTQFGKENCFFFITKPSNENRLLIKMVYSISMSSDSVSL